MESERLFLWIAFNVFVLGMLALDLGVFHRKAHAVSIREASLWSVIWICLAMIFNLGVYFAWGQEKALEFLTGYVIEKSLSVDNLFVFLMIFQYFNTPAEYQHRVLFWGILGALILRAIFIAAGAALLTNFHWMIYIFGAFLVITGVKMYLQGDEKIEPEKNPVVRLFERWVPITKEYVGQTFFVRREGKTYATLLMLVLVVVETTDVIFAVDSIPAIFAITHDPFIVYTSNVFAILGLRALYFMLAGIMEMFVFLKVGLSVVLCFVGIKMMIVDLYKIPIGASLSVIGGVLMLSILASVAVRRNWNARVRAYLGTFLPPAPATSAGRTRLFLATSLGVVVVALTLAMWHGVTSGPTSREVVAVIRVVESELDRAIAVPGNIDRAVASDVRSRLANAWSHFSQKEYQLAMQEALSADQRLRGQSRLSNLGAEGEPR